MTTGPPSGAGPAAPIRSYRDNLQRLGSAQKSNKGAAAYSRFVNRPLGRRLAAAADVLGLSPNQVTGLSALSSAVGLLLLAGAPIDPFVAVGVAAALVLGYALDSADGQLARLQGGGGTAGEFLDHMVDALKTAALHLCVLIGLYRNGFQDDGRVLLLPLAYAVVASVFFFGIILAEQLRKQVSGPRGPDASRPPLLRSLIVLPNDYGLLCLVFLLWGWTTLFLTVYGLLLAANAVFLVAGWVRWYRELSRLDRSSTSVSRSGQAASA